MTRPSEARHRRWNTIFAGIQALTATATLAFAVWAIFFTSLPEMLEKQLRTEVVESKEEAIRIRRANDQLAAKGNELRSANDRLQGESARLELSLRLLEEQKAEIQATIERLVTERGAYAAQVDETVVAQLLVFAAFRLDQMEAVARVCAGYEAHRRWIDAQRTLARMEGDYSNASWEARDSLQDVEFPSFWFVEPQEPSLTPAAVGPQLMTARDVEIFNGLEQPETLHTFLIRDLFEKIVASATVGVVTGRDLVQEIIHHDKWANLLPDERRRRLRDLDDFLAERAEVAALQLNVVSDHEPSAAELVELGRKSLANVRRFRAELSDFLGGRGWPKNGTAGSLRPE